nr:DUF3307 domain-containing protein [Clostridium rectalis]
MLLFILSHFICDFIFQGEKILELRASKIFKINIVGNVVHSLIHLINMFFILSIYYIYDPSILYYNHCCLVIAFFHLVFDEMKTIIVITKPSLGNSAILFLIDQLLHFLVIVLSILKYHNSSLQEDITYIIKEYPSSINIFDKYIIILIVFICSTWVTGIFIHKYIENLNLKHYKGLIDNRFIIIKKTGCVYLGTKNGGFIIGILERIFILIVMCIGQPQMIGFVLTAKSIARFKKLDDSSFAEYFIMGTFLSFIMAIIGGIIIKSLNVIPIIK